MKNTIILLLLYFTVYQSFSQDSIPIYWKINNDKSIVWNVKNEKKLPHGDNIEMAGRKVAGIIYYNIDKDKNLTLKRFILFPQLRTYIPAGQPWWKKYRAYLKFSYTDEILPTITCNDKKILPGKVDSVRIKGKITFYHDSVGGIKIKRTLYPSPEERFFVEKWEVENLSADKKLLHIGKTVFEQNENGIKGYYRRKVFCNADDSVKLSAGETYSFAIYFAAGLNNEDIKKYDYKIAEKQRDLFLKEMEDNFVLQTPDSIVNTLFYFSKIRAAENIFDSKMGLVHSPGGGNYYAGIWANDQAEYSSPFFPYLGYARGNTAAYNCYKWFLTHKPLEYTTPITSSFEMEGDLTCCGLDRGDAAMIAFGGSQYLLALGDKKTAAEIWPLIEWCLEYSHRNRNEAGVVKSTTDEMEGRIETGNANLATSSLYYGALNYASDLANELGFKSKSKIYKERAEKLYHDIETYFGAKIDGLETYRYFDGNTRLRHWICLPLVVDINKRKDATIEALLNRLWTENGVLVELNPNSKEPVVFWDRGTLYALRGTFKAGATDLSLQKLIAFSKKRLIADHVPYVVEAYPENNMRHLSAESALYCRIFTEGLLGIEPTGFSSFTMTPYLPSDWDKYSITKIKAFNTSFDIYVYKANDKIRVVVIEKNKKIFDRKIKQGQKITVKL